MKEKSIQPTTSRRKAILDKLSEEEEVQVVDLSQEHQVSEVTIRKDLTALESKGLLVRSRGGAFRIKKASSDIHLDIKSSINLPQKQRIAKKAATLIREGESILIDSGSTTEELVRRISEMQNITVVTNSISHVALLAGNKDINIHILGGNFRFASKSLVGSVAEQSLKQFHCDRLFLGVDSLDLEHGLSTPNVDEASLNRVMLQQAKKVVLLADASKFGKLSFAYICELSQVHMVITDSDASPNDIAMLKSEGINVVVV